MNQERVNHAKFEGMNGGLKGEVIINKLGEDFELLAQFMIFKLDLPSIGHSPLINLDVILKELFEMATPTDQQWKDIHRVSNHKPCSRDFSLATRKEWLPSIYRIEG